MTAFAVQIELYSEHETTDCEETSVMKRMLRLTGHEECGIVFVVRGNAGLMIKRMVSTVDSLR